MEIASSVQLKVELNWEISKEQETIERFLPDFEASQRLQNQRKVGRGEENMCVSLHRFSYRNWRQSFNWVWNLIEKWWTLGTHPNGFPWKGLVSVGGRPPTSRGQFSDQASELADVTLSCEGVEQAWTTATPAAGGLVPWGRDGTAPAGQCGAGLSRGRESWIWLNKLCFWSA